MSDDLISRKALLKKLEVFNDRDHGNEHFLLGIESAKEIIKNEPTAFDKEKVIEELNSERNLMYREDGTLMGARTQISIDRAVDIVEKGGIE